MANVFRGPSYAPLVKNRVLAPDPVPNLLVTTLAIVLVAPFHQSDFPNPIRARVTPQSFELSGVTTRGIPRTAFRQTDWTVTPGRRAIPQSEVAPNLLAKQVLSAQAPFAQTDWPTVFRRDSSGSLALDVTVYNYVPVGPPFVPVEFPNPLRKSVQQPDPPQDLLSTTLKPGPQSPPFYQNEWVMPLKARAIPYAEFENAQALGVLFRPADVLPFRQSDWVTPRYPDRFTYQQRWEISNLLQSTLAPPVVLQAVPLILGLTPTAGDAILAASGLVQGTETFAASVTYQVGTISVQSPAYNVLVPLGSAVNIVVSSGPPSPVVPPNQGIKLPNLPNQILPPNNTLVDSRGVMAPNWWRFFLNVSQQAMGNGLSQPATVTASASPFVFTAGTQGTLIVSGGPVSMIEYSKDGTMWFPLGITGGPIQMVLNDQVRITYTNPPSLTFFPK